MGSVASLGEEGERVGGLAWPPTVCSHHSELPNQDLTERLEGCTVESHEVERQGPYRGGEPGES